MRLNLVGVPVNFLALAVLLLAGLLTLAAVGCGGGEATATPAAPATATPPQSGSTQPTRAASAIEGMASLSGDIVIDGSSTVFPITEAMAEEFGKITDGNVRVVVGVSGTGAASTSSARARPLSPTPPGPSSSPKPMSVQRPGLTSWKFP